MPMLAIFLGKTRKPAWLLFEVNTKIRETKPMRLIKSVVKVKRWKQASHENQATHIIVVNVIEEQMVGQKNGQTKCNLNKAGYTRKFLWLLSASL